MRHRAPTLFASLALVLAGALAQTETAAAEQAAYRLAERVPQVATDEAASKTAPGPWSLAWSPDGQTLAVTDRERDSVLIFDPLDPAALPHAISLRNQPTGILWTTPEQVFVSEYGAGSIADLDPAKGTIRRRLRVGGKPMELARAGQTLLVADYGLNRLLGLDLTSGELRFTVPVARHPVAVAATPDGKFAVTGGLLPGGPGGPDMTAQLVLVDVDAGNALARFPLPNGASNLRDIAISADGRFAFASHTIGKIGLPTTQPDRGWINTNAITVLDLEEPALVASFLLDTPYSGAADPWGVSCLPDGSVAISVAGTGDMVRFDWPRAQDLLAGIETLETGKPNPRYANPGTPAYGGTPDQLWARIAGNPKLRGLIAEDLAVTSGPGLVPRFPTGAKGLRDLALSPDHSVLAAVAFFDGTVRLMDPSRFTLASTLPLSSEPVTPTLVRQGEMLFHDAHLAFQTWMSCATCHHEGRTDGLNWDLLNDGIGNPKNTKSLLDVTRTEPMTWLGAREDHLLSIKKGMHFLVSESSDEKVTAIAAYFDSLQPEPSPHAFPEALLEQGEKVFQKLDCAYCHSGPLLTDLKKHDVGTWSKEDGYAPYDTPSLREIWRTAPYLHDGSADTLADALIASDPYQEHSKAADLDTADFEALVAYLLNL